MFGIDRFGRRNPWMLSAACCGLCLIYLGAYIKVGHPGTAEVLSESTKKGGNAATAIIMLYALFWSFGGNGLPWIVSAEIFPVRLRSLAGSWAGVNQWLASVSMMALICSSSYLYVWLTMWSSSSLRLKRFPKCCQRWIGESSSSLLVYVQQLCMSHHHGHSLQLEWFLISESVSYWHDNASVASSPSSGSRKPKVSQSNLWIYFSVDQRGICNGDKREPTLLTVSLLLLSICRTMLRLHMMGRRKPMISLSTIQFEDRLGTQTNESLLERVRLSKNDSRIARDFKSHYL